MVIGSRLIGAATIPRDAAKKESAPGSPGRGQARRAIFAHQGLDALPPVTAAFREIGADVAATRDQRGAIGLALVVVTREGRGYITAAAGQRIGETFGVDRRPSSRRSPHGAGRRKLQSPTSATRPKAMRGDSRSKIGCRMICAVAFTSAASCGASNAAASCLSAAINSGRISGGGIETPCRLPSGIGAKAGEGVFHRRAGTRQNGRRGFLRRAAPASGWTASVRRPESRTPSGATSERQARARASASTTPRQATYPA